MLTGSWISLLTCFRQAPNVCLRVTGKNAFPYLSFLGSFTWWEEGGNFGTDNSVGIDIHTKA